MKQRDLKKIQDEYEAEGMLQNIDLLSEIQRALKSIPEQLPGSKLRDRMTHFRVLPLLNELEIYMHAIDHGTISKEQESKLAIFEKLYQSNFVQKPYQQIFATDFENPRTKVVRFDPHNNTPEDLRFILIQNGACYMDTRNLDDIVKSFYHDTLLGGSIISTVETKTRKISKEKARTIKKKQKAGNHILAVGKYFVCTSRSGEPVLAVDMYSHGNYQSRRLSDWQIDGKIDLFGYGPASMLYLAKRLGIRKLAFCDLEMGEFAKQSGATRKQLFHPMPGKEGPRFDNRKAGVISVVDNSKGIYHHQHSIYHESSGRVFSINYVPLSIDTLFDKFETIRGTMIRDVLDVKGDYITPEKHNKMRIQEKFTAMLCILRIMEDRYLNDRLFTRSKALYNKAIDMVNYKNPSFSLPYTK